MKQKFHDVLNSVDAKQGRSPLEPYGELVDTLRDQGLTCRDIAALLAEKCQFVTSKSAVSRFLRARARKRRSTARKLSRGVSVSTPATPQLLPQHSAQRWSDDEIRQKIADVKARKPVAEPAPDGFHYDPDEPLRLINPVKRNPYD
jgi:hypothetical protein